MNITTYKRIFKDCSKLMKSTLREEDLFEILTESVTKAQLRDAAQDMRLLLDKLNEYTGTTVGMSDIDKFIANSKRRLK